MSVHCLQPKAEWKEGSGIGMTEKGDCLTFDRMKA